MGISETGLDEMRPGVLTCWAVSLSWSLLLLFPLAGYRQWTRKVWSVQRRTFKGSLCSPEPDLGLGL